MKTLLKRVLSLGVMLAVLMLPAAALAGEDDTLELKLSNFSLEMVDPTGTQENMSLKLPVDLTLALGIDTESEEPRAMLRADLAAAGQTAFGAMAALDAEALRIRIGGMDYGFYMPLEEIVNKITATVQESDVDWDAVSRLLDAYIRMLESMEDMTDLSSALPSNSTVTVSGTDDITLYDKTMTAEKQVIIMQDTTVREIIDGVRAQAGENEYYAAYTDFMDAMSDLMGEEAMEEMNELYDSISVAMQGTIYTVEDEGGMAELTVSTTSEGKTINMPIRITALEEDERIRMNMDMAVPVDGEVETMKMAFDLTETDTLTSAIATVDFTMADEASGKVYETTKVGFQMQENDEDEFGVNLTVSTNDGVDTISMGFNFQNDPVNSTDDTSKGNFSCFMSMPDGTFNINMDTAFTIADMPEGVLIPASEKDINLLDESLEDEVMDAFMTDLQPVLIQGMGVLASVPEIAEILGDIMD